MPESLLLPGLLVAVVVLSAGILLLASRQRVTTSLQTANHHRQLMDPTLIAGLVMLVGTFAVLIGLCVSGYIVVRLLGLFTPIPV